MSEEYIKALKVCRYFTLEGVKRLCERYPDIEHLKIALKMKLEKQERLKDENLRIQSV